MTKTKFAGRLMTGDRWYAFNHLIRGALLDDIDQCANGPSPSTRQKESHSTGWQPFPIEVLPRGVRRFIEMSSASQGCDPAFLAVPALSVLAGAIGNSRSIQLKEGWTQPSIIWTAVIGESGSGKSPALRQVTYPTCSLQNELFRTFTNQMKDYKAALDRYKRSRNREDEGEDRSNLLLRPAKPIDRRIVVDDTSMAKLVEILSQNPRGILTIQDELSNWFNDLRDPKTLANWLRAWDAGTITYDRKTETLNIPRATISICSAIQPGLFARHIRGTLNDSGLLARMLVAAPPRSIDRWTEEKADPGITTEFDELIGKLTKLPMDDSQNEPRPFEIKLDSGARSVWKEFFNEYSSSQSQAKGHRASRLAKLRMYCARFALVCHVVDDISKNGNGLSDVSESAVRAGIQITKWFTREGDRVYGDLGEDCQTSEVEKYRAYILKRGGSIRVRDLQRHNDKRFPSSVAARAMLEKMKELGFGVFVAESNAAKRSTLFRLHDTRHMDASNSPN